MFCVPSSLTGGELVAPTCSRFSTEDPSVFGSAYWWTLHTMAQNYPDTPSVSKEMACRNFVSSLPYMLPDDHSGRRMQGIELAYPLSGREVCSTGETLRRYFCDAHNLVNAQLGKPPFPCEAMSLSAAYGTAPVCTQWA